MFLKDYAILYVIMKSLLSLYKYDITLTLQCCYPRGRVVNEKGKLADSRSGVSVTSLSCLHQTNYCQISSIRFYLFHVDIIMSSFKQTLEIPLCSIFLKSWSFSLWIMWIWFSTWFWARDDFDQRALAMSGNIFGYQGDDSGILQGKPGKLQNMLKCIG